ncbi:MAG: 4-hydroxy-tetrahydrodipicolinate synthase [Pseudomonadota bacterium]
MFQGSIVALVSPFGSDDRIDGAALAALIDWHVAGGTRALVVAGTTGESATLATGEHVALIEQSVELAAGRIPVIAGTGSNSTAQTLALSKAVGHCDIAGYLVVAPYYNKPNQEGLYRHFSHVADGVEKPVLLYNVPGRTCSDILPATVARLARHDNIVGIKDATGELSRLAENQAAVDVENFNYLSGDDFTTRGFLEGGGHGTISVTANIAPAQVAELCAATLAGDTAKAERLDRWLQPLHAAMFADSNPMPVKWALTAMGRSTAAMRLPLVELSPEHQVTVRAALEEAGLV